MNKELGSTKKRLPRIAKVSMRGVQITTRQILLSLLDIGSGFLYVSDKSRIYRDLLKDYWRWRDADRRKFAVMLHRLKHQGLIESYREDKQPVLILTHKGEERAKRALLGEVTIIQPKHWDHKWHLIIFDIPETNRSARTVFRKRLQDLGFLKIQKSVFIHPFDATDIVAGIRQAFGLTTEIQYIVADQIEQEEELLHRFIDRGTLQPHHFSKK